MKLRTLLTIITLSASALFVSAEKPSKSNAHASAHSQLLANAKKSKIDRSSVSNFIKEDVAERENHHSLSASSSQMLNDLLVEARKHIGKKYRHGSKGPATFDCSGFSSYVYRQFGYNISPASRAQYLEGESVDRKELRKGDLVFFTSRSSGKNVGHVGIVVSADDNGNFEFIHASIKGVKISKCEGYYANRYIGARRIINE